MQNQPTEPPIPSTRPVAAVVDNPWQAYFGGESASATNLLEQVKARPTQPPDLAMRSHIAAEILKDLGKLQRLASLVQASKTSNDTIRSIVMGIVDSTARAIIVPLPDEAADRGRFCEAVGDWVDGWPRPVKPANLVVLSLLLKLGVYRQLLDHGAVVDLVDVATRTSKKPKTTDKSASVAVKLPLDVIVDATPTAPVLKALVAHSRAWAAYTRQLDDQLAVQEGQLQQMKKIAADQEARIRELQGDVARLRGQNDEAAQQVQKLQKDLVELGDGWQHRLDEVRGRIRGTLQGQVTRWLQTSLDAISSEPPFLKAAEERLQDALKVIKGEITWLQLSE